MNGALAVADPIRNSAQFLPGSAPPGPDNSIAASERPYLRRIHAQGANHDNQATLPTADVVGAGCRGIYRGRTYGTGRTDMHVCQPQQHRVRNARKRADRDLAAPGAVRPAVPVLRRRPDHPPPPRISPRGTSLGRAPPGTVVTPIDCAARA